MYIWQVFVISNSINVNRAAWFLRLTVRLPYSPILLFLHIIMFPLLLILIPFDGSKRFPSFMAPIRSDTPIETNLLFIISRNGELSRVKRKKWRFFQKNRTLDERGRNAGGGLTDRYFRLPHSLPMFKRFHDIEAPAHCNWCKREKNQQN